MAETSARNASSCMGVSNLPLSKKSASTSHLARPRMSRAAHRDSTASKDFYPRAWFRSASRRGQGSRQSQYCESERLCSNRHSEEVQACISVCK